MYIYTALLAASTTKKRHRRVIDYPVRPFTAAKKVPYKLQAFRPPKGGVINGVKVTSPNMKYTPPSPRLPAQRRNPNKAAWEGATQLKKFISGRSTSMKQMRPRRTRTTTVLIQ